LWLPSAQNTREEEKERGSPAILDVLVEGREAQDRALGSNVEGRNMGGS